MTQFSSTLVHRVRVALFWGAAALASSCGGSGGDRAPTQPPPEQPAQPAIPAAVPGTLTARLVTPNADDGAILLDITGPAPAVEITVAVQGAVAHSRTNGNTTRVALFGALASGALFTFSVPDVNAAQQFTARVAEASDRASALRTSVTGYQVTVAP